MESKRGLSWVSNTMSIEEVEVGDESGDNEDKEKGDVAIDDRESAEDKDDDEVEIESISTRLSPLSSGDDVIETGACSTGRAFGFLPRFFGSRTGLLLEEDEDKADG